MNIVKKIMYKIYRKILETPLINPNRYAKYRGVNFGRECNFRTKKLGSEPYLITLGDNVRTSVDVTFITHDGGIGVLRKLDDQYKKFDLVKPIKIGNNVFIGWGAIIMPGTTIGNNIIVGSGSVVRGKLLDNSVYAGVPAKYICSISEYLEKNQEFLLPTKHLDDLAKKSFFLEHFKEQPQVNI